MLQLEFSDSRRGALLDVGEVIKLAPGYTGNGGRWTKSTTMLKCDTCKNTRAVIFAREYTSLIQALVEMNKEKGQN